MAATLAAAAAVVVAVAANAVALSWLLFCGSVAGRSVLAYALDEAAVAAVAVAVVEVVVALQ